MFVPKANGRRDVSQGKRFSDVERRLDFQGVVLVLTAVAVLAIGAALLRKGILSPRDLVADA